MPRSRKTWIVVADGSRARFLASETASAPLTVIEELDEPEARRPTNALGTDRPGRGGDAVSASRHAMEPRVDWHTQAKERFAIDLARRIDAAADRKRFDALVIVAPSRTLSDIDRRLKVATKRLLVEKIAKDLTRVPLSALPARLRPIIRRRPLTA